MSLLILNAGSSSLKFALFGRPPAHGDGADLPALLTGQVDGLGSHPHLQVTDTRSGRRHGGPLPADGAHPVRDVGDALEVLFAGLPDWLPGVVVNGIGHRVVHGGVEFDAPTLIDDAILARLEALSALAPLHQPFNTAGIRAARRRFPGVPQAACFDTAFHRGHAFVHDAFALPREYFDAGVRRYGFHGLSYEYIATRLRELDPASAGGRVVVAHLGSGASLCALRDGRSVASSMGFTALDGLPMGTRPGHIDPGVLLWLMTERGMDAAAITDLLYKRSGLKGLSGVSADMRDLHASKLPDAARAIDYFVAQLCQQTAAMAAALGGLDGLVFTAGIGEHDAPVRARALAGLRFLGVEFDPAANARHGADQDGLISAHGSAVRVHVIPTNEELMIARHLDALTGAAAAGRPHRAGPGGLSPSSATAP